MITGFRLVIFGTIVLSTLAACSSSSPVRYFSLNPIDSEFRQDPDDAVLLGLGPFRMPDYLNRSQIVTRGANAEMQVDGTYKSTKNDAVSAAWTPDMGELFMVPQILMAQFGHS